MPLKLYSRFQTRLRNGLDGCYSGRNQYLLHRRRHRPWKRQPTNSTRPLQYHPTTFSRSSSSSSASSLSSSLVSWEVDENEKGKIGTITLKSPETYNALTVEMGKDFKALVDQLEHDLYDIDGDGENTTSGTTNKNENIQAIVLRGAGDQAFSAGGNLEWLSSLSNRSVHGNVDLMLQFYTSFLCLRQKIPVPVIAALQGPAMGAGACLALSCDLRVAAAETKVLGFPFSKLGIPSGMGGLYLLQQAGISSVKATEILLLGKSLTGEEAMDLGLINRLVPKNQVYAEAKDLARDIAHNQHPVAIRSMIRSWRLGKDRELMDALYRDAHAQAMCYNRQDWGRGLQAVKEKAVNPGFDDYHSK